MPSLLSTRLRVGILASWLALLVGLTIWGGMVASSWIGRPFNGFIAQTLVYVSPYQSARWGTQALGLETLDAVLRVNGRPVATTPELIAAAREVPVGTPLTYTLSRDGQLREVTVPTRLFTWEDAAEIGFGLGGIAWELTLVAMVLFWLRPDEPAARALSLLVLNTALILLLYLDLHGDGVLAHVTFFCYGLIGSSFAQLALYFPRRSTLLDRFPWLPGALWGVGLVFGTLLNLVQIAGGLAVVDPARWSAQIALVALANAWASLGLVAVFWACAASFLRSRKGSLQRRQAGLALWGAILGLAPLTAWFLHMSSGREPAVPLYLALYAMALFPAAIAYAIVRARLFDITVVVRNSVLYLALSALLTGVYLLSATGVRAILPGHGRTEGLVGTIVVVALFVPLRDRLQRLIDRKLFRAQYDAQLALAAASRSLTTLHEPAAIVRRMRQTIAETLQVGWDQVYLLDDDRFMAEGAEALIDAHPLVAELAACGEVLTPSDQPTHGRHRASVHLEALGAELAVPMVFEGQLLAFLLLGPKRSEAAYTEEDIRLLGTLANQGAIALSNAQAYQRIQAFNRELEAMVEARTQALERAQAQLVQSEKMSALGQLVAGIAHELNNPLTFVYGGVELLEARLGGLGKLMVAYRAGASREELDRLSQELDTSEIADELPQLIAACKEGATRAQAIVRGLRFFSRMEDFEREPVDLRACVESTVPLVAPSFQDRIAIALDLAPTPPVPGSAIHLGQVVMNLLVNACQAIPARGRVAVRLIHEGDRVVLAVEDDGPGMSEEVKTRLFEPFFTTKPVGEGTGMGLSICHGIIEQHGGRIEVESRPGGGSCFRVLLPHAEVACEPC